MARPEDRPGLLHVLTFVPHRSKSIRQEIERIRRGGSPKSHEKAQTQGKLFARERIRLLLDSESFVVTPGSSSVPAQLMLGGWKAEVLWRPASLAGSSSFRIVVR